MKLSVLTLALAITLGATASPLRAAYDEQQVISYCSAISGQYRYFAEFYANGATWRPGADLPVVDTRNTELSFYDSMLYASYNPPRDKVPDDLIIRNRQLIEVAFMNSQMGLSVSFGQMFISANCLNVISQDPQFYAQCDYRLPELTEETAKRYYDCFMQVEAQFQ